MSVVTYERSRGFCFSWSVVSQFDVITQLKTSWRYSWWRSRNRNCRRANGCLGFFVQLASGTWLNTTRHRIQYIEFLTWKKKCFDDLYIFFMENAYTKKMFISTYSFFDVSIWWRGPGSSPWLYTHTLSREDVVNEITLVHSYLRGWWIR